MATLYPPAPRIANGRQYAEQAAAHHERQIRERSWSRHKEPSEYCEMDFPQVSLGWARVRGCTHRRYTPRREGERS